MLASLTPTGLANLLFSFQVFLPNVPQNSRLFQGRISLQIDRRARYCIFSLTENVPTYVRNLTFLEFLNTKSTLLAEMNELKPMDMLRSE